MSGGEPIPGTWRLQLHDEHRPSASSLARIGASSPSCPVCRGSHGSRLVRSLEVSTLGFRPSVGVEEQRGASKYYPPAVPVLNPKSTGPIGRSARWSFSLP